MTKPEARRMLMNEARYFKYIGASPLDFQIALDSECWRLTSFEVEDAYNLVSSEIEHIKAWVWNPIKG